MANYRDPKVTNTNSTTGKGGAGRWIGIALAALVLLLLLAWLFGAFNDDVEEVEAVDDAPVVTTEEPVVVDEPAVDEPEIEPAN